MRCSGSELLLSSVLLSLRKAIVNNIPEPVAQNIAGVENRFMSSEVDEFAKHFLVLLLSLLSLLVNACVIPTIFSILLVVEY